MFIENLKVACAKKGTTPTALLKSMGMSTSSVTAWKKGVEPSVGTVYKIAQKLGCDPSDLLEGWNDGRLDDYNAGYVDSLEKDWADEDNKKAPTLSKKDERDVARDLEAFVKQMETKEALMFDGNPLTEEARESILAAMKLGLEAAKAKNKARFTPKKYRGD